MDILFENEYGSFGIDPETAAFYWEATGFEEADDLQVTEGGAEYSIFEDDELDDALHIEISPDFVWSKEDVWELVEELLYKIGEIDEEGNLIGAHAEKPLYVIECPGSISYEQAVSIEENAKLALAKANIDAVTLILSDGIKTYFDRVRR